MSEATGPVESETMPDNGETAAVAMHRPNGVVPYPGWWELSCRAGQRHLPLPNQKTFPPCGHPYDAKHPHHWNLVSRD